MTAVKKFLHNVAIAILGIVSKFMPDKVPVTFMGPQALTELCESIGHVCPGKVLIVTDAVLVEIGLIDRVTEALQAANLGWSIYSGIESDPKLDQVEAGYAQLEREACKAVLAVGGGSPMDAAKLIAAMATNPGPLSKLEGAMKVKHAPMPLFAVPTTAGTGSEVTIVAVASDPQTHAKKFFMDAKLLPMMTALDPTLMAGMPAPITAATGMDALTHAVESYLSRTATPTTQQYATTSVRLVFDHLPTACADGANLEARKAMALASYYGGLAFTRTSVGYVHAIAHTFGAFYRTPHGLANAIALPYVLEFSKPHVEDRLARLAELIGCEGATDRDKAEQFIGAVRGLMSKIDIPDKLDALLEKDVSAIAAQAVGEAHLNYPVPRYMSQPECEVLLRQMIV